MSRLEVYGVFFYSLIFGFVVVFPGCIGFGWSLA